MAKDNPEVMLLLRPAEEKKANGVIAEDEKTSANVVVDEKAKQAGSRTRGRGKKAAEAADAKMSVPETDSEASDTEEQQATATSIDAKSADAAGEKADAGAAVAEETGVDAASKPGIKPGEAVNGDADKSKEPATEDQLNPR